MMWSLTLALLTALQVVVVVARSVNKSLSATLHDQRVKPVMSDDDIDGCYVVTIFGLKTADCGKHSARSVPTSLDSDLQVSTYYYLHVLKIHCHHVKLIIYKSTLIRLISLNFQGQSCA